jgi:hypothetical protein
VSKPTCEVCGKPAVVQVADIRETAPVRDEQGGLWRNWERTAQHAYCLKHQRPGKVEARPVGPDPAYIGALARLHVVAAPR